MPPRVTLGVPLRATLRVFFYVSLCNAPLRVSLNTVFCGQDWAQRLVCVGNSAVFDTDQRFCH